MARQIALTTEELAGMAKAAGLDLTSQELKGLLPLAQDQLRQAQTLRDIPLDGSVEPDMVFLPDRP